MTIPAHTDRFWRRWPTTRIEATMAHVDDSTPLYDAMAAELAEREHEHQTRVNNGGTLP